MSQATDVAENDYIDSTWRGQTSTRPSTWVLRLLTAAAGETGGGTEATYTGYAPVSIVGSLANFAGTQSPGSTLASSGTGGQTSNNGALVFGAASSGATQTLTHFGWFAAAVCWFYGGLTATRTMTSGDQAPTAAAGQFTMTFN
jgi:hypothetical protein